jgi:hypothetical protein
MIQFVPHIKLMTSPVQSPTGSCCLAKQSLFIVRTIRNTQTHSMDRMQSFSMLKQMVHIVTTGRAVAQVLSRRLLTAVTRVRSKLRSSGMCGGRRGNGAGFFQVPCFPLPILISPAAPHASSRADALGPLVAGVPSGLRLIPPSKF